jgi:hypothetical protein
VRTLLLAIALSGSGCQTGREAVVEVPEPMVYDLVRGLGAAQGEFESNVLAVLPTKSDDPYAPLVAPEIEYAALDGLGLELELPFEEDGLASVKVAAQWTFGSDPEAGFIHGTQLLAERLLDVDGWELALVYIPAWRFDESWSLLTMFGVDALIGSEVEDEVGVIANATLFADVSRRWVLGFEVNALLADEGSSALLMPQAHFGISERVTLQFGAGAFYQDGASLGSGPWPPESLSEGWFPQISFRLILEF